MPHEVNGESAAGAGLTRQFDRTMVRFGDPFYDRETQSETVLLARTGFVDTIEPFEDTLCGFWSYADTGIGDPDTGIGALRFKGRGDFASRRRISDGIV